MIPQGYKQTEIGIIPKDWELKKISKFAKVCMCKRIFSFQTKKTGDIPFYKIGTFGKIADSYIDKELYYDYRQRFSYPTTGDILFSAAGTLGRTVVFDGKDSYFQDSNIVWLDIDKSQIINDYLYHYYQVIKWASSEGSTISRLYNGIIYDTNVIFPKDITEQEKIAEALSDTDDLITSLEKLIEKKKAIKRGAMQNLLTGKTRLPGFTNKWEEIALNELFDFAKGTGLSKEKLNPDGKNKCILYGELFTRYEEIIEDVVNHTDENIGVISKAYDVLMPCSTTTNGIDLATASVIMKDGILLGGDIAILRPKNKMDSRIFGYLMRLKAKEIVQYTQGSTIVHLNIKSFAKMKINITLDYDEQKAIAEILSDMDKEIKQLEQKLAKARLIKQGMMQQLLTGKIRIV